MPGGSGDEPAAKQPRLPRTTKVVGGAVAVAMIAGGAWAAGTALHSSPSTVKFRAAASTGSSSSGGTSGSTNGPRHGFGMGMFGGGVVGTIDQSGSSFTITRPSPPSNGNTPNAPGGNTPNAPSTPSTPATTTRTIKVSGSTKYYLTQ
ncbi:MAG TPA: hypothetical protein VEG62_04435, partial [Acidimicrobiales bacterium]|nr:hypothetical protein [Acidimicrobiales bacterium]